MYNQTKYGYQTSFYMEGKGPSISQYYDQIQCYDQIKCINVNTLNGMIRNDN